MRKIIFLFLCFFAIKSNSQNPTTNGFKAMETTNFFYADTRSDSTVNSIFLAVDMLIRNLKTDNAPNPIQGKKVVAQVTVKVVTIVHTIVKDIMYETYYTMGKGEDFVFFHERYPAKIGPLFSYEDRGVLALAMSQYIYNLIRWYKAGEEKPVLKNNGI